MRGKARACWWTHRRTRDHPRVCGEKLAQPAQLVRGQGSPPHVRGKEYDYFKAGNSKGITPAHAGKRLADLYWRCGYWDHPRTCGEKDHTYQQGVERMGSPPHVRGKGLPCSDMQAPSGITPACAGKSAYSSSSSGVPWDHPRMCGEKSSLPGQIVLDLGSPPHVRGKGRIKRNRQKRVRITPACAGKSVQTHQCRPSARDHPRMCGEKNALKASTCAL